MKTILGSQAICKCGRLNLVNGPLFANPCPNRCLLGRFLSLRRHCAPFLSAKQTLSGVSFFSLVPLWEQAFSHSWLLLNLTGANWGRWEMQKRHRIDRQTESRIRCFGCSGGDTQPSLLLFSLILFILLCSFLCLYSLRPYSFIVF
jgi:hypothetical protein